MVTISRIDHTSKGKVPDERFLSLFLHVRPSRLSGFAGAPFALFIGHGFKTPLAADLPALSAHLPHDLLDDGKLDSFNGLNGLHGDPASALDGIKFCISACPLWHMPLAWHETGGTSIRADFK